MTRYIVQYAKVSNTNHQRYAMLRIVEEWTQACNISAQCFEDSDGDTPSDQSLAVTDAGLAQIANHRTDFHPQRVLHAEDQRRNVHISIPHSARHPPRHTSGDLQNTSGILCNCTVGRLAPASSYMVQIEADSENPPREIPTKLSSSMTAGPFHTNRFASGALLQVSCPSLHGTHDVSA